MYLPTVSFFGFVWATSFVPGGAIGVALKLNSPNMYAYADNFGFTLEVHNKFNVISPWWIRRSHSLKGKPLSIEAKPALKWVFQV